MEFGYAGKILRVDLSNRRQSELETADYAERFLGGRGFAAKLYWDMVPATTRALEPENCFLCVTGPTAGFSGIAGCRWQVCGKSPSHEPEAFSYGNLGGKWGPALKAAGFDALAIQGKADKPVYLYIHDGMTEIRDGSALWGQSAFDTIDSIRAELGGGVSVLTTGPAGENQVVFATVMADEGASGGGGLGSVMGSKKLKAIAVAGNKSPIAADPERLQRISERVKQLRSFAAGRPSPWGVPGVTSNEDCYGCGIGCSRQMYTAEKGRRYKSFCQQTGIYSKPALDYFGKWNEVQLKAIRLCDGYSLDSAVMAPLILWLIDCHREGIINEKETGLPLSRAGSPEFIETLTRKIAYREGFGGVLAEGILKAATSLGGRAKELAHRVVATRSYECRDYDPRLMLTTALFYATEPRRPINLLHGVSMAVLTWLIWVRKAPGAYFSTDDLREAANRFWGGAIGADFSTWEGKALAAKKIQDRTLAKESLILCDLLWPMMSVNSPSGHVGDPTMENQIYSAITGKETDEAGLAEIGERVCNLQRAIQLRQGWGGRKGDILLDYYHDEPLKQGEVFFNPDALMPGPDGNIISKLGCVVERDKFENLKSEYYRLRGWDVATGFPTRARLENLGLQDITGDLEKRGLLR